MAEFNPTITPYLAREGYDNKSFDIGESKVEHISYTMSTCALSDMCTLAFGPATLCMCVYIYIYTVYI